ncbi:HNH endonuclease [Oceanobacillus sp. FSL K6-0127]|uniref:HNH endonuclease n=1 Tax=Oceanobacillus sp. FSL K6-0127 TaxID=2921420 RepID=UPI0030EDBEE1
MKKLTPPAIDSDKIYKDITRKSRSRDKKERLTRLEQHVLERYVEYDSKKNSLENITKSEIATQEDKDALLSCYSRNKDGYLEGEVVATIISIQSIQHKQKCPYCGLDKPRTIDHYIPKGKYPEFSFFPSNLIPCCGYCNSKKGETWLESGKRVFLNLYFDNIPEDDQFLFPVIEFDDKDTAPTISFTLERNENINDEMFTLINSHYLKLNLLNEYSESVEEELSNIVDQIQNNPDVTIEEHKENLSRVYRTNVKKYGLNHWKSVFIRGLMQSDLFFENAKQQHIA